MLPDANRATVVVVIDDWDRQCSRSEAMRELSRSVELVIHEDHVEGEDLQRRLEQAEVVVPFRERSRLDGALLARLPHLRLIAQTGKGIAHIDTDAASRLKIEISTTPGASSTAVAELALGLLLAVSHRIAEGDRMLHGAGWRGLLGREIYGRTLGILGFGKIGKELAPRATACGMEVLAWSRGRQPNDVEPNVRFVGGLDELLSASDCLTVHLPLSAETEGLLKIDQLNRLPQGALLINTARAQIIDEDALIETLTSGRLAGAGLDVHWTEPLPRDSIWRRLPRVVLTPHVGWTTEETQQKFLVDVSNNIGRYLSMRG